MLKVDHVTKYYDDFLAVNDISFEIKEGEIFGLLGVNGAGKTTTFRMIMGLLDKSSGEITLNGKKIDYKETDKIGFLTEERSLIPSKTVLEQAIYYGVLKGLKKSTIEKRLDRARKMLKADKKYQLEIDLLERIKQNLENGVSARSLEYSDEELPIVKDMWLLSSKPILYVTNISEEQLTTWQDDENVKKVKEYAKKEN